jgi:mannose-1-phosphate guanylyltransferase / mannose-6-phosphate isomerase
VKPLSPATGYGYILPGAALANSPVCKIQRFVEKPNLNTAKNYVENGYLWNSGNFMFSAKALIDDVARLAPDVYSATLEAVAKARRQDEGLLLDREAFAKSPRVSFDYAVMEKTAKACVLPVSYSWSDIGSWDAVSDHLAKDENENAIVGHGSILRSTNVTVHSENVHTAVIGCDDLVVVATRDAVLVAKRGQSELVKDAVKIFEQHLQGTDLLAIKDVHSESNGTLVVQQGQTCNLEIFADVARYYVVLSGSGQVQVARSVLSDIQVGGGFCVSAGETVRVANTSEKSLSLLEVKLPTQVE